jgi:hypothetical protein
MTETSLIPHKKWWQRKPSQTEVQYYREAYQEAIDKRTRLKMQFRRHVLNLHEEMIQKGLTQKSQAVTCLALDLGMPLSEQGLIAFPLRWGVNMVLRELDPWSYGENSKWGQDWMRCLNNWCEYWGNRPALSPMT